MFFCEEKTNGPRICGMTVFVIVLPKWSGSTVRVAGPLVWLDRLFVAWTFTEKKYCVPSARPVITHCKTVQIEVKTGHIFLTMESYESQHMHTLRCLINGRGVLEFQKFVNIGNEWKKRHQCLILMLNLRVSKRTKSENSKNKVIIKRVSNISINWVNLSK